MALYHILSTGRTLKRALLVLVYLLFETKGHQGMPTNARGTLQSVQCTTPCVLKTLNIVSKGKLGEKKIPYPFFTDA